MDPLIDIRPFQPADADYQAVAHVNALAPAGERQDFEPRTGDALKRLDGKLGTIEWARSRGYRRIWAGAESTNPAILALNQAFGYVKTGGLILLETKV